MNIRKNRLSGVLQKIKLEDEIITEYCKTLFQVPLYMNTLYIYFAQCKLRQQAHIGSGIFLHPSDKV